VAEFHAVLHCRRHGDGNTAGVVPTRNPVRAAGVTDGNLLQGVRFTPDAIITHTIVMRSSSRTVREI
jgi:fructose-1,6-bisphosphatase/sedoheptulose 1,7-bisphosphatase-like protein